jgi:hypothetical protein
MSCLRRKPMPRREHMRPRLPKQKADMRITPRPHVIGSPGSEFETLPHCSNYGHNIPKDGEVETRVQRLSQGGWGPPGRKVGWGGDRMHNAPCALGRARAFCPPSAPGRLASKGSTRVHSGATRAPPCARAVHGAPSDLASKVHRAPCTVHRAPSALGQIL